jgi:hypothetical protein
VISKLQVDYQDSNNPKTFRLVDDSEYNPKIEVCNTFLEVTPPGFNYPTTFKVKPYFNMVLNASILNILKVKSVKLLADLPDGTYHIKYSISPNDELFVEYDYFRTVKLMYKYSRIVCGLLDKKRDYTVREFDDIKQEILWIRQLIESAKDKVEVCSQEEKGIDLYNEASHLLNKYVSCLIC